MLTNQSSSSRFQPEEGPSRAFSVIVQLHRLIDLRHYSYISHITWLDVLLGLTCLRGSCWVRPVWTWWRCCWCWWRCWGCWSCSRCCSGETLAWPSRRTHLQHINTCSSCIILGWIFHHVTDDDDRWFDELLEFHRSHTCDVLEKGHYFSKQPHVFHYILDYVQHLLLWHHPQFTTFCRIGSVSLQTWNVQENEFTTEVCWNLFKWRGCCTAPAGQALYTRCTHLYFVHTACTHLLPSSTNIEWHIPYLLNVVMLTLQF